MKTDFLESLSRMEKTLNELAGKAVDYVSVLEYEHLTETENGEKDWTKAFQRAIDENAAVYIPFRETPYVVVMLEVPSDRHILADKNAVIRQKAGVNTLMLRNKNTVDGRERLPDENHRDKNIFITGGRWEKCGGTHGYYDESDSMHGVLACLFFNNLENLRLKDVTVVAESHCFATQFGAMKNALIENISFEGCRHDGVHLNGQLENVVVRNAKGRVGDDLVALNMHDWDNSGVNFGPMKNVLCEDLEPCRTDGYKALRILPARHYFPSGDYVDCTAENIVIRNVKGIDVFKLYLQPQAYEVTGQLPELHGVGRGDNILFENISVDIFPGDRVKEYMESDPVKGYFGAFEIGAHIGNIVFKNVTATVDKTRFPLARLVTVGPKSARLQSVELFAPYADASVKNMYFENVTINGERVKDAREYVKTVSFENVNLDGCSSGTGRVENIVTLDV